MPDSFKSLLIFLWCIILRPPYQCLISFKIRVQNFSQIASPLCILLTKEAEFAWTKECDELDSKIDLMEEIILSLGNSGLWWYLKKIEYNHFVIGKPKELSDKKKSTWDVGMRKLWR